MDVSWLVRARWRLVGAWMWPAFVVLAFVDGLIGHALPLAGDSQSVVGGIVLGLVVNLVVIVVLAHPLGRLLRIWRRDLPVAIARNYAGTLGLVVATAALFAIGLGHQSTIAGNRATMRDAAVQAAAWIGDHAPAQFRARAAQLTTVVIQSGTMYRECAENASATRDFCVVVDERKPAGRSVVPDGSEPNQALAPELN